MDPVPNCRTLYEDWKARLEQLNALPHEVGDYQAIEVQLLEYLLHRYHDSAESARTARFPLKSELYINYRALVVFQHLADGSFPTMTNAWQTHAHVKSVLLRMSGRSSVRDATEQAESMDGVEIPSTDPSVHRLRMRLCNGDTAVRTRAVLELTEVGNLDDLGLLSDLLALPSSPDEHPQERAALVHALRRLAGTTSEEFDMAGNRSGVVSRLEFPVFGATAR